MNAVYTQDNGSSSELPKPKDGQKKHETNPIVKKGIENQSSHRTQSQRTALGEVSLNSRVPTNHNDLKKNDGPKPPLSTADLAKVRREPSHLTSLKRKIYKDNTDKEEIADNQDYIQRLSDEGETVTKKQKIETLSQSSQLQVSTLKWDDLDHVESNDICMVTEYTNEIFYHLYQRELQTLPSHNYLLKSTSKFYLRPSMRAILVDWLVEVHEKFQCHSETLFLAINLMDRFLSGNKVTMNRLQLLAVTSLFIAAKFEEVNLPKLADYAFITDGAASKSDIKNAEMFMLTYLEFNLGWPNPMNFLRRISKADHYDYYTRNIGKYLLEIAICSHFFVGLKPSYISAMCMFIARLINKRTDVSWNDTFIHYSGGIDALNDREFIANCERLIEEVAYPKTKLESLTLKYQKPRFGSMHSKVYLWCKNQSDNEFNDLLA